MKIKSSGAALSGIVRIGENLRQRERQTGQKILPLHRGINMVCRIDLNRLIGEIDFNTETIQNYPPSRGSRKLRQAVNTHFFQGKTHPENTLITAGGMNGLDLILQSLDIRQLFLPAFYWGSYLHILTIRRQEKAFYQTPRQLVQWIPRLRESAVLICDPGNPLGEKQNDSELYELIRKLNDNGISVLVDSPYRRLFTDDRDEFYARLAGLPNIVVCQSFSKSLGLSGQRIGFIHTANPALYQELHIRLMYCTNGINGFAQEAVWRLLDTPSGQSIVREFKRHTLTDIGRNLEFLKAKGLLATNFYTQAPAEGLFAVIRCGDKQLLEHRIGSVPLSFFTQDKEAAEGYSRICVSYPHREFVEYFLPESRNRKMFRQRKSRHKNDKLDKRSTNLCKINIP
ncbi:MAG: pyridoxal phosphate-dependent aminotransferase [Rikenellaceae bacterium]|nr:pyridoxal phosphate-dependent aminotransferase [Rikenellaceae bacterium]